MKLKRIAACVLTIASVLCTSVSAMAASPAQDLNAEDYRAAKIKAAEEIAYMDVETAFPAMKDDILEARKTIIYNQTWIADGYEAIATDPDGTVTSVPHFSELFPGWDCPIEEPQNVKLLRVGTTGQGDSEVYLQNPSTTVNSEPFLKAYGYEESLYVKVKKLDVSETCNFGFMNDVTGESVGVFTRKPVGFSVELSVVPGETAYVSVRASTYSTPGYGTFFYNYW